MCCEYFLPVCDLPVYFLDDIFDEQECFIFMKFHLSFFVCLVSAFLCSEKSLLTRLQRFAPVFLWFILALLLFSLLPLGLRCSPDFWSTTHWRAFLSLVSRTGTFDRNRWPYVLGPFLVAVLLHWSTGLFFFQYHTVLITVGISTLYCFKKTGSEAKGGKC